MPHHLLFLDFETYYDDQYSLRHLTPPEYILDPRYETIGCAVKVGVDGPTQWVDGPDFPAWLAQYPAEDTTTVTFNALFDNCILAWRYGYVPSRMLCAMRMAAALRGHKFTSMSLSNVAKELGVGVKQDTIMHVKGMRRAQIMQAPHLWASFKRYACNDTDLCAAIFMKLLPEFPHAERRVMDRVLRCAVEPRFLVDRDMLKAHLEHLTAETALAMQAAGVADPSELRSATKFIDLLHSYGVDVEYKPSVTDPSRQVPAFAKTDEFMERLQEHDNPIVQALAAARLGVRSTIEQTRGERLLTISSLSWPATVAGTMPIPLRYSGAHTHRLAGEWSINMQNLPSGRGTQKSKLRKALVAPPGHKVVVADLSQIECRITAVLCGQHDLTEQFAKKLDPYSILASDVFGFPVDKKVHLTERFIGKSGVLGLGFGCGAEKFYNMVVRSARLLGMDMKALLQVWTPTLAQTTVDIYRHRNQAIRAAWYHLDNVLSSSWCGRTAPEQWGPVIIGEGYVEGPSGLRMLYDVLPSDERGHRYRYGKAEHRMYGPKFLENIVQFLARIVIMHTALRIWDRGFKFALQAHDELAFIVPDAQVDEAVRVILEEMHRRPSWMPGLPLAAEHGVGQSYGDAK